MNHTSFGLQVNNEHKEDSVSLLLRGFVFHSFRPSLCVSQYPKRHRNGEGAPQTWRGALTHSDALHWNPELLSMCFCYLLHPSQGASATVKLLFRYAGASKHLECVQTERERERESQSERDRERTCQRNCSWIPKLDLVDSNTAGCSKADGKLKGTKSSFGV